MKSKHPKYPFEMAYTLHVTVRGHAESFRKYNEFHLLQSMTLAGKYNNQTQLGVGGSLLLKPSVVT
jgi:hypothetical protein